MRFGFGVEVEVVQIGRPCRTPDLVLDDFGIERFGIVGEDLRCGDDAVGAEKAPDAMNGETADHDDDQQEQRYPRSFENRSS